MMMGLVKDYRYPAAITTDEVGLLSIRVTIVLPGLKKKRLKNAAANGCVDIQFGPRNLQATFEVASEHYRYTVKKLPGEIYPEKCTYKIENNKVILMLEKVNPLSWAGDLSRNGLETEVENENCDN